MASHFNCAVGTSVRNLLQDIVPIQSLAIFLAAQIAAEFLDKLTLNPPVCRIISE